MDLQGIESTSHILLAASIQTRSKIVVFGGAGFIGSHLLQRLKSDFPHAGLFCVDVAEPRFLVDGVTYLHHDLRTPIPAGLCGDGPALIFNLAAVHVTPGHKDWEYYWTNVLSAGHVCRFATATGSDNIVFTSSISVYGSCEEPKDETSVLEPTTAYGRSKLLAEKQHETWQEENAGARRLTIVRPAVIYGPTERGNFTRLAHLLARGRFVYPGRRNTVKACGYVKDLVASMLYMNARTSGVTVYNFCYPDRYTSSDICAAFCEVAGFDEPRLVAPMRAMMFAALGFEVLGQFGVRTSINRDRLRKLFHSTNVVPKRLQDAGFPYAYTLKSSLADWHAAGKSGVFI